MSSRGYEEALAALKHALVFGINPSLEGVSALCEALGRPQDAFAVVQVTGTNGKTSTARFIEALLRAEGIATALYTSPELERYPERFEVGGAVVSDDEFAKAVFSALDAAEVLRPGAEGSAEGFTEFELATAAALWLFRAREVEIAVLEVGMGGRWDATSVAAPAVAVITGVGLDHMAVLGDTLEAIAAEKAAIIRPGSAPVLGPRTAGLEQIFLEQAQRVHTHARAVREVSTPTPVGEDLTIRFSVKERPHSPGGDTVVDVDGAHGRYPGLAVSAPSYQAGNVATAIAAAEAALGRTLEPALAHEALVRATLPGRFELMRVDPPVVVDGSHNPQAAAVLAEAIAEAWPDPAKRPLVLLGVLADKDAEGIVRALAPVASGFAVTAPASPRALPAADLADVVERVTGTRPETVERLRSAVTGLALACGAHDGLVITGSLTTAGQARTALGNMLST